MNRKHRRAAKKLDIIIFVILMAIALVSWTLGVISHAAFTQKRDAVEGSSMSVDNNQQQSEAERASVTVYP